MKNALFAAVVLASALSVDAQFQPFGVDVERFDPSQCNASVGCPLMDEAAAAGAQFIRLFVLWRYVEPNAPVAPAYPSVYGQWTGQHTYDWSELDYEINRANNMGIQVYLVFDWAAPWANGNPQPDCSPLDANQICANGQWTVGYAILNKYYLLDLAYNAAVHFGSLVNYYGVWNEPNVAINFNLTNPSDPDYNQNGEYLNVYADRYLSMVWNGIKQGNPSATVVGGEVATNACGTPPSGCNWYSSWVQPLYQYFSGNWDIMAVHEHRGSHNDTKGDMDTYYALTNGSKPIWTTENDYSSGSNEPTDLNLTYVDLFNRQPWWQKNFYTMVRGDQNGFCTYPGLVCDN